MAVEPSRGSNSRRLARGGQVFRRKLFWCAISRAPDRFKAAVLWRAAVGPSLHRAQSYPLRLLSFFGHLDHRSVWDKMGVRLLEFCGGGSKGQAHGTMKQ
eukprot:1518776-Amphidinium_carterae.1